MLIPIMELVALTGMSIKDRANNGEGDIISFSNILLNLNPEEVYIMATTTINRAIYANIGGGAT